MKNVKVIIAMFLIGVLALTACGKEAPSAPESTEPTETAETMVSMANPWVDCTEEEAKTHVPRLFQVPEGAENVAWSVMHPEEDRPLVQAAFDLDGLSYNARAQVTGDDAEDISGMYYTWDRTDDITLANWGGGEMKGTYSRAVGEETADLITWYDVEIGISYSLSTVADDLDGFDLQAIAESMYSEDNEPIADMP